MSCQNIANCHWPLCGKSKLGCRVREKTVKEGFNPVYNNSVAWRGHIVERISLRQLVADRSSY